MFILIIHTAASLKLSGELAYKCARSFPFESKRAVAFVEEVRKYVNLQSTLEILESPPADYPMPATDILGGLDDIQIKASASHYSNHYDFDLDLQSLFASAFDGHLSFTLCSTSFAAFLSDASLVSISSNGIALPEVYVKGSS